MELHLITGNFNCKDAIYIIAEMVAIKIRFHEGKIAQSEQEEDIKFRESKIKTLQNELFEIKKQLSMNENNVNIESKISIN